MFGDEKTVLAGKDKVTSTNLLSDQRGAVAFEMLIVWLFLMMGLLLPLADLLSLASSLYPRGRHCVPSGNLSSTTRHLTSRTRQVGRQANSLRLIRVFPSNNFNSFAAMRICLLSKQQCFAQVLFIHDDRHPVADGVKTGVV